MVRTANPAVVFQVKEQINGATSNSRLIGAAAVPNGTNAMPSLFLLDAERKALTLCERDAAGVWQVVRTFCLAGFGVQPFATGGVGRQRHQRPCVSGLNSVGLLPLAGDVWELTSSTATKTELRTATQRRGLRRSGQ